MTQSPTTRATTDEHRLEFLDACGSSDRLAAYLAGVLAETEAFRVRGREIAVFLLATCRGLRFSKAAEEAGIQWNDVRRVTLLPELQTIYDICKEIGQDYRQESRKNEADRRAIEGWDEEVYGKGGFLGTVRRYSDRLLETLLKANEPRKFDPKSVQGPESQSGVTINYNFHGVRLDLSPEELRQRIANRNRAAKSVTMDAEVATTRQPIPENGQNSEETGR